MKWQRNSVFLLLTVLSIFWSGCGGFHGVLAPTLSSINPTSVAAGSAAFTLTASGTNFAQGTTILWDGVALPTTVSSSTQLTAKVTADQIATAGAVSVRVMKTDSTTSGAITLTITGGGPGGGGSFRLDSISPPAVAAGSSAFTLTATGAGFISGASITLNGTAITTSFDSATQLHATIPAANVASAGSITVGVTNPDKSTTNTLPLTVIAGGLGPAPTLTSISPNTSPSGITSPITLTATGTNFVSGSKVLWNGQAMTTTFVSATQLTATIPASQFNIPASFFDPATGTVTVQVFVLNPDSTVSNQLPFTITLPPTTTGSLITVFNPAGTQRSKVGDAAFTLTLCGSSFVNGSTAYWGTTALPTSAVTAAVTTGSPACPANATDQVTAQVPASLLTSVAEIPITIQNPSGKKSNDIPYYVGMNIYFDESADVVWDSRFNLLYVSKPSTAQKNQNTVMAFSTDPNQGLTDKAAIWTLTMPGNNPNPDRLALSADGKYLYVALDGTSQIQQLAITGASSAPTLGATIPLGSGSSGAYYAMDMALAPGSNTILAVARGVDPAVSNQGNLALGGVAIYDAATQQQLPNVVGPSSVSGGTALLDTVQWASSTTIYAANNENAAGDLYVLSYTPGSGVTLAAGGDHWGVFTNPNLFLHMDPASGLLYGDDGLQVDPTVPQVKFNSQVNGVMAIDHAGAKAYFVYQRSDATQQLDYKVEQFDLATLNPVPGALLDLYQVQGIPQHVIRFNNGLAFTTKKFSCKYSPCTVGDGRLFVIYNWP